MTTLPDSAKALVDAPEVATVATVEPDGQPQLSVVWVKRDGDDILFSTLRGRRKTDNLERTPQISVLMFPKASPYTYLEVRGTAEITDDPSSSLIHELSQKYTQSDYPAEPEGNHRVIVRVKPNKAILVRRVTWPGEASPVRLRDASCPGLRPARAGRAGIYVCGPPRRLRRTSATSGSRRRLRRAAPLAGRAPATTVTLDPQRHRHRRQDPDQVGGRRAALVGARLPVRARFAAAYDALGVLAPTYEPRATGHVTEMVELIETLIDARAMPTRPPDGCGDVYFDVRCCPSTAR